MKKRVVRIALLGLCFVLASTAGCASHGLGYKTVKSSYKVSTAKVGRTINTKATIDEPTAGEFTVANYFGDDMIVPRDKEIVIWGFAPESENGNVVYAEFKGLKGSATIANGEWKISLNGTLPASAEKGNTLIVKGKTTTYEYRDVLVGDIWVLNGQSNADLTFAGSTAQSQTDLAAMYKDDLDACSENDNIRVFRQNPGVYGDYTYDYALEEPQKDTIPVFQWALPVKSTIKNFPMLGYFFAKYLVDADPSIPIGVITTSWGGATLQSLSSPDAIDKYPAIIAAFNFVVHNGSMPAGGIYNAFISPVTNVEITGMVFFQGESEGAYAEYYGEALKEYVDDLRVKFNTDFEFIEIQVSSYGYYAGNIYIGEGGWANMYNVRFQQSSLKIYNALKNYEVIPSYDLGFKDGDGDGAHPYYKKALAKRAADMALARVYNKADANEIGCPIPSAIEYSKNTVYIKYDYVGEGLVSSDGRKYVSGFEVFHNGFWSEATAYVSATNEICIDDLDEAPKGVRYCAYNFFNDGKNFEYVTLTASNGNPAVPFQIIFD